MSRLPVICLVVVGLMFAVSGCHGQGKGKSLPVQEFKTRMEAAPDGQVVDVRTPQEFAKGHLKGAFNVDISGKEFAQQVSALDKSKPVFVYCLSGGRSEKAASYMRSKGFTEVYELKGGVMQWNAAKQPLVGKTLAGKGLSSPEFHRELEGDKLVLVDFFAPWCAPCKKMAPELKALEQENSGRLRLLKINADDNRELMDSLGVNALPQLMLFKDGKQVWSNSGLIEKEKVRANLEKNF